MSYKNVYLYLPDNHCFFGDSIKEQQTELTDYTAFEYR